MLIELGLLVVVGILAWAGLRAAAGERVKPPGSVKPGPTPRGDGTLFRVPDRRLLPRVPTLPNYDRPADIQIPDDHILNPPRQIEGRLGE